MIAWLSAFTAEYGLGAKTHVNDAVINGWEWNGAQGLSPADIKREREAVIYPSAKLLAATKFQLRIKQEQIYSNRHFLLARPFTVAW